MQIENYYTKWNHLEYVEFHVVDRCNLNCNACSHFSPMVQQDFDHLPSFKADLRQLKSLFDYIIHIRLLGGEPFLDDRLDEYAAHARALYPYAKLEVVTNGLLIPGVSERVLTALSENDVIVNITAYPPTERRKDSILSVLEKHGVRYDYSAPVTTFRKRFSPDGRHEPGTSFAECTVGRRCTFVYQGRLYLCSGAALVKHYNACTGADIVCQDSSVDLYHTTAKEILQFLERPNDSCRYCGKVTEEPWSACRDLKHIDVSHWITEETQTRSSD